MKIKMTNQKLKYLALMMVTFSFHQMFLSFFLSLSRLIRSASPTGHPFSLSLPLNTKKNTNSLLINLLITFCAFLQS